jgi:hypothetical protein
MNSDGAGHDAKVCIAHTMLGAARHASLKIPTGLLTPLNGQNRYLLTSLTDIAEFNHSGCKPQKPLVTRLDRAMVRLSGAWRAADC